MCDCCDKHEPAPLTAWEDLNRWTEENLTPTPEMVKSMEGKNFLDLLETTGSAITHLI